MIPEWLTNGLGLAASIMPAYGIALLLGMMMTFKNSVFMILGFLLAAYFKLDLTGISLFGIVIALILREVKFGQVKNDVEQPRSSSIEEGDILDTPDFA